MKANSHFTMPSALSAKAPATMPVYWHQGMYLQPQHFQQSEQHLLAQQQLLRQQSHPWCWGVAQLTLIENALARKSVELQQGEFVFADGSHAVIGHNATLLPRSFADIDIDPENPLTVYLALRRLSAQQANVSVIDGEQDISAVESRYFTHVNQQKVDDIYQQQQAADIQPLQFKLEIIFQHEVEQFADIEVLPLAQIVQDGENLVYQSEFIPPLVSLQASDKLSAMVKELRDELAGRAFQLAKTQQHQDSQLDANGLRYRLALQALSRYVPRLHHLIDTPLSHPWNIYGSLRELIGEISSFSKEVNFLGETAQGEALLAPYRHDNIGCCFDKARSLISRLLNEISIGPQFVVALDEQQDNGSTRQFQAAVPAEFFQQQVEFYLVLHCAGEWSQYSDSFSTSAKIATRDHVALLAQRSLPGVGFTHIPSAPAGLPEKADSHYIRLNQHDELWAQIERGKNIALLWDEAPDNISIELAILAL